MQNNGCTPILQALEPVQVTEPGTSSRTGSGKIRFQSGPALNLTSYMDKHCLKGSEALKKIAS